MRTRAFGSARRFPGAPPASRTAAADAAFEYCQASGIQSLAYIGSLAVVGTQLAAAGGFLSSIGSGGSGYEPSPSDVADGLDNCNSDSCQEAIGSAILPLAEEYCEGGGDQAACEQINDAVSNAGGDPDRVGELLICLMQSPPIAVNLCPTN
jgi:hypothetical protein